MTSDPLAHPERLVRRVYAYAAYRLGDGADAEDVTAEVFERALRYRATYDPEKGEPVAWLLGIARRSVDAARGARPEVPWEPDALDAAAPGDLAEEAVQRLTLAAAVGRLGERDRDLVALRYGADLTAETIAELLGMEVNSAEVALRRALARLRRFVEAPEVAVRVPGRAAISRT